MLTTKSDKIFFLSAAVLVILYTVGFIGIHSASSESFLQLTSINLLSGAILLGLNHKQFNTSFFIFCIVTFISLFFIEVIGVKTGILFGEYSYGKTLGVKVLGVPLIIGLNWLMLIYIVGGICNPLKINIFLKSFAGAAMLVILDCFIEPVAIKFDFWSWHSPTIPLQNYLAWFIISFLVLVVFNKLKFDKTNRLAKTLFIVQLVFFILLNITKQLNQLVYITLILLSLAYPLLNSFENKINYFSKWKYLFPGVIASAVFFISWDVWFTHIGVWKFNPEYVVGLNILNLPFEEWSFFIVIPFSCVFIYESVNYFIKNEILVKQTKYITILLAIALMVVAIIYHDKLYTFTTFMFLSLFLLIHHFIIKSNYMGKFYLTWVICLVPFILVNGVLTSLPVLIYNDNKNMGIRLYTIPIEDIFYGMLNILQVITVFELLRKRNENQLLNTTV